MSLAFARSVLFATSVVFSAAPAFAASFAYVTNQASGTVSVIDTGKDDVVRTLGGGGKLSKNLRGVIASRDGRTLFLVDAAAGKVEAIDIATDTVKAEIPVGKSPEGIGISAKGDLAAACVEEGNSAALIDVK